MRFSDREPWRAGAAFLPAALLLLELATPSVAQRIPAATIVAANGQTYPVIATTGAATYVAWTDYVHVGISRSLDGSSWSAPVAVDRSPSCESHDAQIAVGNGWLFVVWAGSANCGPFGAFDSMIRCNRSNDGGATWMPADIVLSASAAGRAYRPQIAVDGSNVVVVWEDDRDGPTNVYCNRSLDSGATWLPTARRLDTDAPGAAISARPRLSATPGTVCVVWMDYRHSATSVYGNRSLDGGTTWLANDVRLDIAAGSRGCREPEVAADGLSVCVVWRDRRHWTTNFDTDADVYANRSLDGGATWLPAAVRVGPGPVPGVVPCLEARIARAGSTVHACWRNQSGTFTWDVVAKRSLDGGATWSASEPRLCGAQPAGTVFTMLPAIAATPDVVAVAWLERQVPGNVDLFCNRSIDGGQSWLPAEVRLDTTAQGSQSSSNHALAAAAATVRAAWVEGPSVVANLPFGFVRYGSAMTGSGGLAPHLAGNGVPAIGGAFSLDISQGLGGTVGILAVGAGPASRVAIPLLGGTQSVDPFLAFTAVLSGSGVGTGTWSLPIAVPAVPAFVGLDLNFQALLVDAASPSGFVFTNAVEAWIG